MKRSRSQFKDALNFCRSKEQFLRKQQLTNAFINKGKCNYWKEIKKMSPVNTNAAVQRIDNETGAEEIVNVFKERYKSILDDKNSQSIPENYDEMLNKLATKEQINKCSIFKHNIDDAIGSLSTGLGWDGIHSNHLKLSGEDFRTLLSRFLSSLICHGHVPPALIRGEIRPILKNPLGNKSSSDNYRPVMNSSYLYKLLEYCLLPHLYRHLRIHPRQFAYRKGVGCMTAGALLKETVSQYKLKGSSVHCLLIDYSKAYDKTNNRILLCKMIESNLPKNIVLLFKNIFENSFIGVRFQNVCCGSDFKALNGIRQGGIASGILFTFYINEILDVVSKMNSGCSLARQRANIIAYADDLTVVAPCMSSLQNIVDIVYMMSVELCLSLNVRKTQYIVFVNDIGKRKYDFSLFIDGRKVERVYDCKYLGIRLCDDFSLTVDIEKCHKTFLGQFNSMFYKFNFVGRDQLIFLFNAFCMSFYGIDLWHECFVHPRALKEISIAYHKALKRITGLSMYHNNHDAAMLSGQLLMKHLVMSRAISLLFRLSFSDSICLLDLRNYFMYDSIMSKNIRNNLKNTYEIESIFENSLCAIKSRIMFVQNNEPRSEYVPIRMRH